MKCRIPPRILKIDLDHVTQEDIDQFTEMLIGCDTIYFYNEDEDENQPIIE